MKSRHPQIDSLIESLKKDSNKSKTYIYKDKTSVIMNYSDNEINLVFTEPKLKIAILKLLDKALTGNLKK